MPSIHPTAVVDSSAQIESDAWVGPYCIIGPGAKIGSGSVLESHVHIAKDTQVGTGARIAANASLGGPPQSTRYRGGPTRLVIGNDCDIREGVTINRGTEDGGGLTLIGNGCFFMANSHVGHDCRVGNNVVMANAALLGGHCIVGDNVVMGGLSAAHQHTRIGANAMVSGVCGVQRDVIPFGVASGGLARLAGLNIIGMKRRNIPRQSIHAALRSYRTMFRGSGPFRKRVELAEAEAGTDPIVGQIIAFIRSDPRRGLLHPEPRNQTAADGSDTDEGQFAGPINRPLRTA